MDPTLLIGLADCHWMDKKPRSRKDDFLATQFRKMRDVFKLARSVNWHGQVLRAAGVCIAGDLFHQSKGSLIKRSLDQGLLRLLRVSECPVYAIPGNHDMDRDRLASLDEHPMGSLVSAGLIENVCWPDYALVGREGVPVIILGRQAASEGPRDWLLYLKESGELRTLKQRLSEEISEERGESVYVHAVLMTHCYWGPKDQLMRGDPIMGYMNAVQTGADVVFYGHPHTFDGVQSISDEHGVISIAGPGALIRGTLAEVDINRKPMIGVMAFNADGTHEVRMVPIPHEPAEVVFDLETHDRKRRIQKDQEHFIEELQKTSSVVQSPEEALVSVGGTAPPKVIELAKSFIRQAKAELEK